MTTIHGIEQLRRATRALDHCTETFLQQFTPEQLLTLHAAWSTSGYDTSPDKWSDDQVVDALNGWAPQWDECPAPCAPTKWARAGVPPTAIAVTATSPITSLSERNAHVICAATDAARWLEEIEKRALARTQGAILDHTRNLQEWGAIAETARNAKRGLTEALDALFKESDNDSELQNLHEWNR